MLWKCLFATFLSHASIYFGKLFFFFSKKLGWIHKVDEIMNKWGHEWMLRNNNWWLPVPPFVSSLSITTSWCRLLVPQIIYLFYVTTCNRLAHIALAYQEKAFFFLLFFFIPFFFFSCPLMELFRMWLLFLKAIIKYVTSCSSLVLHDWHWFWFLSLSSLCSDIKPYFSKLLPTLHKEVNLEFQASSCFPHSSSLG